MQVFSLLQVLKIVSFTESEASFSPPKCSCTLSKVYKTSEPYVTYVNIHNILAAGIWVCTRVCPIFISTGFHVLRFVQFKMSIKLMKGKYIYLKLSLIYTIIFY